MADEAIFTNALNTKAQWEAENEAAVEKAAKLQKKRKLKFQKQRKPTKDEKREAKSAAPGVTAMIERLKKQGMAGLKTRPSGP